MKTPIKILIVAALAVAVIAAVAFKKGKSSANPDNAAPTATATAASPDTANTAPVANAKLPRMLDLGAGKCIPCKMMAPILAELKRDYADHFVTEFIDVWVNPDAGKPYGIEMIPTQIFLDAEGKELFRHVGFFGKEDILGKWKELGVDLSGGKASASILREEPVSPDTRPRDSVCFLCDGDVNEKTKTFVKGKTEQRILCSPHCYFIYFSSIVGADAKAEKSKVSVIDWASGKLIPATSASYLYGMDANSRPTIRSFADKATAAKEQQASPGNLVSWDVLRSKELSTR
jgi:thioredoxin 1